MKNLNEFKALIERYESITEDEIDNEFALLWYFSAPDIAERLTGYGTIHTCTLCKAVGFDLDRMKPKCYDCVYGWGNEIDDYSCTLDKTYFAIEFAKDAKELLTAFRERAKYMRTLLPKE